MTFPEEVEDQYGDSESLAREEEAIAENIIRKMKWSSKGSHETFFQDEIAFVMRAFGLSEKEKA